MKEITNTETKEPSNLSKLTHAFIVLESVFETIENEDALNLVKLAMDNIADATSLIIE